MLEIDELEYNRIIHQSSIKKEKIKDDLQFLSLLEYQILKSIKNESRAKEITLEINKRLDGILKKKYILQTVKKTLDNMVRKSYIATRKDGTIKRYFILALGEEKILEFEIVITRFYL